MDRAALEAVLQKLASHAWESEVRWSEMDAWASNFNGQVFSRDDEQLHALFALSRFMYFGKKLVREMLRSLYRDHFESPLLQRIRRTSKGTSNSGLIRRMYKQELLGTRFVGLGNPAESGAHLLYYFRQVNRLPKTLFVDFAGAFIPTVVKSAERIRYTAREQSASRYVFFDDLVGSGAQATSYLLKHLRRIRAANPALDLRFMSLFATTAGLRQLNAKEFFDGHAMCLFELDDSFKAFGAIARYFKPAPKWFSEPQLLKLSSHYGGLLQPSRPLGYKDGQLLLGFTHNTPDNTLPIFWDEGERVPWSPVFVRYDKNYGGGL